MRKLVLSLAAVTLAVLLLLSTIKIIAAQPPDQGNIVASPFIFDGERSRYETTVEPYQVITVGVSIFNGNIDNTHITVKIPFWYENLLFKRWGQSGGMVGSWHNWGEQMIFEGEVICHSPIPSCRNGFGWEYAWLEFMVYDGEASFVITVKEDDYPEWQLRPVTVAVRLPRAYLPLIVKGN